MDLRQVEVRFQSRVSRSRGRAISSSMFQRSTIRNFNRKGGGSPLIALVKIVWSKLQVEKVLPSPLRHTVLHHVRIHKKFLAETAVAFWKSTVQSQKYYVVLLLPQNLDNSDQSAIKSEDVFTFGTDLIKGTESQLSPWRLA